MRGRTKKWLRLQQKQVELRPRIVTEPGVQEEVRRNGVETEKNKDNFCSCDDFVTYDDDVC